jgi:hypothetical protein
VCFHLTCLSNCKIHNYEFDILPKQNLRGAVSVVRTPPTPEGIWRDFFLSVGRYITIKFHQLKNINVCITCELYCNVFYFTSATSGRYWCKDVLLEVTDFMFTILNLIVKTTILGNSHQRIRLIFLVANYDLCQAPKIDLALTNFQIDSRHWRRMCSSSKVYNPICFVLCSAFCIQKHV